MDFNFTHLLTKFVWLSCAYMYFSYLTSTWNHNPLTISASVIQIRARSLNLKTVEIRKCMSNDHSMHLADWNCPNCCRHLNLHVYVSKYEKCFVFKIEIARYIYVNTRDITTTYYDKIDHVTASSQGFKLSWVIIDSNRMWTKQLIVLKFSTRDKSV